MSNLLDFNHSVFFTATDLHIVFMSREKKVSNPDTIPRTL